MFRRQDDGALPFFLVFGYKPFQNLFFPVILIILRRINLFEFIRFFARHLLGRGLEFTWEKLSNCIPASS